MASDDIMRPVRMKKAARTKTKYMMGDDVVFSFQMSSLCRFSGFFYSEHGKKSLISEMQPKSQ